MAHVPRLYRPGHLAAGPTALDAEQSRRLSSVMRLRDGDEFRLFCGDGREWRATVTGASRTGLRAEIHEVVRQSPAPALTLETWCALIRPNRFEVAIEKCTEAGADIIRPLITDHTARGDHPSESRLERWNRIAIEAAEQSGRLFLPVIAEPMPFADAVRQAHHPFVFADLEGASWREIAPLLPESGRLAVAIGPEGGWSDAERALARSRGALIAHAGDSILRTETAAVVFTALVRAYA
jgi:16S rRNA (uracil1498-N3)-methyltransferase